MDSSTTLMTGPVSSVNLYPGATPKLSHIPGIDESEDIQIHTSAAHLSPRTCIAALYARSVKVPTLLVGITLISFHGGPGHARRLPLLKVAAYIVVSILM